MILGNTELSVPAQNFLEVGVYKIDLARRIVTLYGKPVELKPKEFHIAVLLFKNIGTLISREKIMQDVWATNYQLTVNYCLHRRLSNGLILKLHEFLAYFLDDLKR